ncbi:MAG: hypothetical protein NT113_22855 [Hyphomicrobiales bacterium]|jgi:hypothetical protein|nr:hypothetical protein [Hyphomicrobiales bacterium]
MNNAENDFIDKNPQGKSEPEASDGDDKTSPAGTHDKPELTDHHKTPGTGMLSDEQSDEVEGPSG